MPKYLIRQYSVCEYQFEVKAKNKDDAYDKVWDEHKDVFRINDGNPVAYHDCYSRDKNLVSVNSTIEELVDLIKLKNSTRNKQEEQNIE